MARVISSSKVSVLSRIYKLEGLVRMERSYWIHRNPTKTLANLGTYLRVLREIRTAILYGKYERELINDAIRGITYHFIGTCVRKHKNDKRKKKELNSLRRHFRCEFNSIIQDIDMVFRS